MSLFHFGFGWYIPDLYLLTSMMWVTEDLDCCKSFVWWEAICKRVLLVSPEAVNLKSEEGEMRRESLQILVAVRINPMLYSRSQ